MTAQASNPSAHRRLRFVPSAPAAADGWAGGLTVVLDAAWTPGPGDRPDLVSVRRVFGKVVGDRDLFREALDVLDRWADESSIAECLDVEGVTYWMRVRESLWQWAHERLLWRYALASVTNDQRFDAVTAPADEFALIDVLHALGHDVEIESAGLQPAAAGAPPVQRTAIDGLRALKRRFRRFIGRRPKTTAAAARRQRDVLLAARFDALQALPAPRALVLTLPSSYQRVGTTDTGVRRDPNLGSVIPALASAGLEPIVLGWGMSARDDDRSLIDDDERLLPSHFVKARFARPEDEARATTILDATLARLDGLRGTPFDLAGIDLTTPFLGAVRRSVESNLRADVPELARVERFIESVKPAALLTTQEAHRTPWLIAGARAGVPTFALQHGVLYATHPGYADRRHPGLILPTCTFVFGEYEQRVLEAGAYRTGEVAVSGSPRLDLDVVSRPSFSDFAEREGVREELGVADGDRLLVVSTVHTPFIRRSHLAHALETCLGGPLPGVHIVIKQHPGEQDEGPYRALLEGLARAGGYDAPRVTVVKDIDLYRLLRAADAHLGLHSTVLTDAVVAGTCNLIAMVDGCADLLGYVPARVARPIHDVADVRRALDDPKPAEATDRDAFVEDHFRRGNASALIAEAILDEVRRRAATPASADAP